MPLPRSVTRVTKDGVTFVSSVDRCSYTIKELSRAALRDVGKFVVISINKQAQHLHHDSMKKSKRVRGSRGAFQYWARKKEGDLLVGVKHGTWYGENQELGAKGMKKKGFIRDTVYDNIPTIIEIESQYLSALEDEARALSLISDEEYMGGDDSD